MLFYLVIRVQWTFKTSEIVIKLKNLQNLEKILKININRNLKIVHTNETSKSKSCY